MDINRNNYEEYFLLFADNELTDYEKIEVLKFIRENKDLENEFRMIQNTICKPDNVVMENKANLLKDEEAQLISEKNYEEIFVLYHDHELNNEERIKTELYVHLHPQLKNEFDLLGQARLTPDNSIMFAGKQDLYKKEKTGKTVPLIFWRSMAAAVFIGFGFWIFQTYQKPALPAATTKNLIPFKKTATDSLKNIAEKKQTESSVAKANDQTTNIAKKEKPFYKKEVVKHNAKTEIDKPSIAQSTIKYKNKIDNNKNNKEEPAEKIRPDVAVENEIKNIPQNKTIDNNDIPFVGNIEVKLLQNDKNEVQPVVQSQPASYVTDTNVKNENYVFYNITTEEFRKSKVGGFLKKVKRIVERNNPVTRLFSGEEKQVASN